MLLFRVSQYQFKQQKVLRLIILNIDLFYKLFFILTINTFIKKFILQIKLKCDKRVKGCFPRKQRMQSCVLKNATLRPPILIEP